MSDKCPKCGAEKDPNHAYYICGTWMGAPRESSRGCLRRQLAAANAKLAEMARLAEESRSEAMVLSDALAKARGNRETFIKMLRGFATGTGSRGVEMSRAQMMLAAQQCLDDLLPQPPKEADDA